MTPEQRARIVDEQAARLAQLRGIAQRCVELLAAHAALTAERDQWREQAETYNQQSADTIRSLTAEVEALRRERAEALATVEWQARRLDALQAQQRVMRDPERKMVCDILANGKTYEAASKEQAEAEVAALKARLKYHEDAVTTLRIAIDDMLEHDGHMDDSRVQRLRAVWRVMQTRAEQAEATAARLREALEEAGGFLRPLVADAPDGLSRLVARIDAALAPPPPTPEETR